tara:strand:- start:472 stop:1350 length:879 start_codon:yes stop_codon:yes gene_type:complete
MSLIRNQQIVHINSAFRTLGTDSRFDINIPLQKNNNFTHIAVLSASIPKSYYLIAEGENSFIIRENTVDYTITLPVGNYTITSLIYTLNVLFTGDTSHYSVTFPDGKTSAQTGKMTFSHNNVHHDSAFIFNNNHLPEVLGFVRGSTNDFITSGNTSKLTSTNVCNFQRESTIFLHSSCCSNGGQDDILLELFASGNPDLSNINFESSGNLEPHSKILKDSQSNNYSFYITDEYRDDIFLNGVNMLITLCFYEKNKISALTTGFIKYVTMYIESLKQESENNDRARALDSKKP